ncbi:MAG TPA: C40 family peptidase [Arthrobacter sp.]|nr:C40 family peptidase [Arthrobacter sp.]
MTTVDVVSRMGQIQSVLQQLADIQSGRTAASSSASAAGSASGATDFASALAAAQGTAGISGVGNSSAVTAANPNGATGNDVVADAKKYLGVPYVWGGTDRSTGFDCSGLVKHVFKDLGVSVPRLVRDQMNAGQTIPSLAQAKPGDLLVMNGVEHIGIYLGNNQYLHAPEPGQKVSIADIPAGAKFDRIVRVVPATSDTSSVGGSTTATSPASTLNTALTSIMGASALGSDGSGSGLASLLGSSGLGSSISDTSLSGLLASGGLDSSGIGGSALGSTNGTSLTDLVAAAQASLGTGASL